MRIARTTRELAAELGTTRRTITAWLKRPDSPGRTATGGLNVARWRKWLAETGLGTRTNAAERDPTLDPLRREKLKLQAEKIALEAEAVRLQNCRLRGEIWSEAEVCRIITDAFSPMVASLRGMKHRIAAQVCGLNSGAAAKVIGEDMRESVRRFEIPAGLQKHPFYGPIRTRLQALQADLDRGARTP